MVKQVGIWVMVGSLALSCSKREPKEVTVAEENDDGGAEVDTAPSKEDNKLTDQSMVSGTLATITTSLTNNSQTSKAIRYEIVRDLAEKLKVAAKSSRDQGRVRNLQGLLATQRLGGANVSNALSVAKAIVTEKLKKDGKATLSEEDQLNIALAAIRRRQYAAAEIFLEDLVKSKDKNVAAGANTALGLMMSLTNNITEAVIYWRDALKAKPDYEAAHLNIGYTALKYGRFDIAQKSLQELQNDWFALAGLAVSSFMLGEEKKSEDYCEKALAKKPNDKTTLFNCGVQAFVASGKSKDSEKYFGRAMKIQGSSRDAYIDEEIYKFQGKMERMIAERREQEELRKMRAAEERELRKIENANKPKPAKGQPVKAKSGEPSVDNLLETD